MTVARKPRRLVAPVPVDMTPDMAEAYQAGYVVGHRHGLEDAEKELRELVLVRDELAAVTAHLRELIRARV